MNRARAIDILRGEDRSLTASLLRGLTRAAEPAYRARFDNGKRPAADLGLPTLSVGNLTTGGTGKTPMVIDLCQRLQAMGHQPAVLLRGYKTRQGVSDETEEIRASLPGVRVVANPSRIEGARQALAPPSAGPASAEPGANSNLPNLAPPTCFVLDDGFQHRQAQRNLDLVLIDATCPWGFDHLLPRGLLREPKQNLSRADAVIVTRADQATPDQIAAIDAEIQRLTGRPPLAHTAHRWTALRHDHQKGDKYINWGADRGEKGTYPLLPRGDQTLPIDDLATRRVCAVSAIGNPAAFEETLARHCRQVLGVERRDDHHAYTAAELARLIRWAADAGADALVTTEKDYVKWRPLLEEHPLPIPVYRPALAVEYRDGEAQLDRLLRQTLDEN